MVFSLKDNMWVNLSVHVSDWFSHGLSSSPFVEYVNVMGIDHEYYLQ